MNQVGVMRPPRSGTSKQLNTSGSIRGQYGSGRRGYIGVDWGGRVECVPAETASQAAVRGTVA